MSNTRCAFSQWLVAYKGVTAVMLIRNKDNKTVINLKKKKIEKQN